MTDLKLHKVWDLLKNDAPQYSDESLSRETLGDDYQQLFVVMVLDHVNHVIECIEKGVQPEPMRLLLLGTAGTGKTRAVRTVLQEIQRHLARADLPCSIDKNRLFGSALLLGRRLSI